MSDHQNQLGSAELISGHRQRVADVIPHSDEVDKKLLLSDKTLARAHTCIRPQKKGKKLCPFPRICNFVATKLQNFTNPWTKIIFFLIAKKNLLIYVICTHDILLLLMVAVKEYRL